MSADKLSASVSTSGPTKPGASATLQYWTRSSARNGVQPRAENVIVRGALYSLIVTAKMNDIDPQAWLADVLARIADHPARELNELMPWNWTPLKATAAQAA